MPTSDRPHLYVLSRRAMIGLLGTGVTATALVGCGMSGGGSKNTQATQATAGNTAFGGTTGGALTQPTQLRSVGGLLEVALTAAPAMLAWGNGQRYALTYRQTAAGQTTDTRSTDSQTVQGPTLRVRPGDTLRITLTNALDEATNLHTHGLHVSPEGNSDNISLMIDPGQSLTYEYHLPSNHPSGTFWYHPHLHHQVASQVSGGLAGVIIVEDAIDERPEMRATTERILVLSDPRIGADAQVLSASSAEKQQGREGDVMLVSGGLEPSVSAAAGSVERWRIVNASASRYYRLSVDAPDMYLIGTDQGRLPSPLNVNDILLTPGQRAEVLVPLAAAGTVTLSTTAVDRGSMSMGGGMGGGMGSGMGGGMSGTSGGSSSSNDGARTTLLTVAVTAAAGATVAALPTTFPSAPSTSTTTADSTRSIRFGAMSMGDGEFVIDGMAYEPGRIDTTARLGTTEDWTITNNSMMDHPLHLHVWPFRVTSRSDDATPDPGWRDTVNIPAGQSVTIQVRFEDFGGTTVYHCHILDHEDLGMMANIRVE